MAYSQLQIYNNALTTYLGEGKLATLSDDVATRYLLDGVWETDPVKHCLEQGQWQFATRTVEADYDPGLEPDFGFRYGFEQPEDFVITVALSSGPYFIEPYNQFANESGYWWADITKLYIKYVSEDESYGRDTNLWSTSFFEYISAFMAYKIVNRVKNSTTSRKELKEEMKALLSEAQGNDGINRPTSYPSRGSWNHSRNGRSGATRDYERR